MPALDDFGAESARKRPAAPAASGHLRTWGVGAGAIVVAALAGIGFWGYGETSSATAPSVGTLHVETDPSGAEIRVDGTARGATPATFTLPTGRHSVVVRHGALTREMTVTIRPGAEVVHQVSWSPPPAEHVAPPPPAPLPAPAVTTRAAEPVSLPSGWMAINAPIALNIYEDGRLIGVSEADRIMLPAGTHTLELASAALGFRVRQSVRIQANATTRVPVELPRVPLSVNAVPWADVWIDGVAAGQTPVGDLLQTIGTHDVEFRHPQLGTKRARVTISMNEPARVAVDMRTP
jgi:hypothetical protein